MKRLTLGLTVALMLGVVTFGVMLLGGHDRTEATGPSPNPCGGPGSGAQITLFKDVDSSGTINAGDVNLPSGTALVPGEQLLFRVLVGNLGISTCDAINVAVWARLPGAASFVHVCNASLIPGAAIGTESRTCDGGVGGNNTGVVADAAYPNGVVPYKPNLADRDAALQYTARVVGRGDTQTAAKCALSATAKDPNQTPTEPGCYGATANNDWAFADISVVKTAKDDKVVPGDPVSFNIVVTSIGKRTANNVTLTDILPGGGKTWTIDSDTFETCDIIAGTLSCSNPSMAPAATSSVQVSATSNEGQCPGITNTARVSSPDDTDPSNNSSTATIRINCPEFNPPIAKCVIDDVDACIELGNPHLANLWLCNQDAITCDNKESGVEGVNFNLNLLGPVNSRDPKCYGPPKFNPIETCARQTIGGFEFEVRYDSKLISVQLEPGSLWPRVTTPAGEVVLDPRVFCETIRTENGIQFRCNTKGKELVINGPGTLAVVHVRPTADDYSILIPSQLNGIVTQLINQDCNLIDTQGNPIKLAGQTIPGVGAAVCDDADVTIRYLEGDVHADCVIDIHDQQQIAFRWGSHLGQILYNSRFDLEPSAPKLGDGDIDGKDLQTVFGRHESSCVEIPGNPLFPGPHPAQPPIDPKAKVEPPLDS